MEKAKKSKIGLSEHFTYKKLISFTMPSIAMMIFISIYGVIDGLFVSNIVGSNALSAINIISPPIIAIAAIGFMLGTGGSAEIAKTIGEGDVKKANKYFSMIIYTIITAGTFFSALFIVFIKPIAEFLGASDIIMSDCITYGKILLFGMPAFVLQTSFQSFLIVAEKPHMAFVVSVLSGVTNIVLDFLFVYVLRLGVAGAAIATVCGYVVGGVIPLIYFILPNKSKLKLVAPKLYPRVLLSACANGSSEMLTNISASIVSVLFNLELMKYAGEDGVAAFAVIMYVNFIFSGAFFGLAVGTAPIISYNFGAENRYELKNIFKKLIVVTSFVSVCMLVLAELLSYPIAKIFVGKNIELMKMTVIAFRIFSISFLFSGINIFASSFFTALCNGRISAFISFMRTLVLQCIFIFTLSEYFGLNGLWISVPATELFALGISVVLIIRNKDEYGYV